MQLKVCGVNKTIVEINVSLLIHVLEKTKHQKFVVNVIVFVSVKTCVYVLVITV